MSGRETDKEVDGKKTLAMINLYLRFRMNTMAYSWAYDKEVTQIKIGQSSQYRFLLNYTFYLNNNS